MPDLSDHTKQFFRGEITNERDGGVSPATVRSAIDSYLQAPDVFFPDAQVQQAVTDELLRLVAYEDALDADLDDLLAADNPDSVKSHPRMPRGVADSEWRAISESLPHGAWIEPANDDTWVVSHPEGAEVDFTDFDKAVRFAKAHAMPPVPDDFPVQPIDEDDIGEAEKPTQCGTCGRWWDDGVVTAWTPTPAARCPFEYFHPDPDLADDRPAPPIRAFIERTT